MFTLRFEGELVANGVTELLRLLARARRDGVVRIRSEGARGVLALRRGRVMLAAFEERTGREAMRALSGLERGRFEVELTRSQR